MKEVWKDIVGYENKYQISNYGNVRSFRKDGTSKLLKPRVWGRYLQVDLSCKENKHNSQYIHRLVASHFIPNPRFVSFVNHKDGNVLNNKVDNLEWTTNEENIKHGIDKLNHCPFGIKPKRVAKFNLDGELIETFESIGKAVDNAKQYNEKASRSHISECCYNKIPSAYGYKWQFTN